MKERDLIIKWLSWKKTRDGSSFSQKKLAVESGISPTYLSNIITGMRNPGTKTLERIAGALGLNMAEFYAGPSQLSFQISAENTVPYKTVNGRAAVSNLSLSEGMPGSNAERPETAMEPTLDDTGFEREPEKTGLALSDTSPDQLEKLFDTVGVPLADLFSLSSEHVPPKESKQPEKTAKPDGEKEKNDVKEEKESDQIPLLTRAPSGDFQEWFDGRDWEKFSPRISRCSVDGSRVYAVQVFNNSMAPDLHKGDVLILNPDDKFTAIDGGICVVIKNGRFLARKIYLHKGEYLLIPSNSSFKMETAPIEGTKIFRIVLWIPAAKGKF